MTDEFNQSPNYANEAAKLVTQVMTAPRTTSFTSSTGVVLKVKPISRVTIMKMMSLGEKPRPPRVMNPDKGVMEENPDDPRYAEMLQDYEQRAAARLNDALLLLATELVSMPEGFEGVEGAGWKEEAVLLGEVVGQSAKAQYLGWLYHRVLVTEEDFSGLWEAAKGLASTSEESVKQAEAAFPSRA